MTNKLPYTDPFGYEMPDGVDPKFDVFGNPVEQVDNAITNADELTDLEIAKDESEILNSLGVNSVDDIPEDKLEEVARILIDSLNGNSAYRAAVISPWETLTDEDKTTLYNNGTLPKAMLNHFIKIGFWRYDSYALKLAGDKLAPTARSMVQLGLLTAPQGVSAQQLAQDAQSDQRVHAIASNLIVRIPALKPYAAILKVLFKVNSKMMQVKSKIATTNADQQAQIVADPSVARDSLSTDVSSDRVQDLTVSTGLEANGALQKGDQ